MSNLTPTNATIYSIAWPLGMNTILQQAIIFIDTIIVGGLGESAIAATGIANAIAGLILGVLFALSNGTQIVVSQAFGSNNPNQLKSGFWSGLIVGAAIAAMGIILIFLFYATIIDALTDDRHVASMATNYLLISTIVIAGIAICQNISVFLYATDKPKIPFYSKLMELPFNVIVSYTLVYGVWGMPAMGVAGAAIGSALAVMLRLIFLVSYLYREQFAYLISARWMKNSISASVRQHLRNALPIAGTFISMNFAFTLCMMFYSQLAVHEFAALTVLLIWVRTSGMLVTAWCQAIGIVVGRLIGQGRADLLDNLVSRAWRVAIGLGFVIAVIYAITPLLFSVIYPNLEPKTLNVIRTLLPVLIVLPFVRSSNTVCGNVLRAAGQANYAFKVHVTTQWLFSVPMTALFVLVLDASILWVFSILFFEELLKAIPFHTRIARGEWKQQVAL